ncbi:TPA: hypothetical protein ACMDOZ_002453 [Vibrio cholerae]
MQYKKLSDDSYKVGGQHSYKYSDTRKDLSALWEEVTGESNKFLGGWLP